ncbi:peptide chain release factor N(5)-glutamine methyltransferase [Pseudobdellovibrio exovorus]|uniref:Release factor glutamine methyltransferase n=1 Tax=Pseudobdellovibrio exovorus JSS TaxID=1184267 RepID=M4VMJ1_9BACT|nr:peptide chain release factor N(5)-glutamine methyltransferase [Pseudobdellovibrio exovorus]AGH94304.1 HemK protein [Pseudobdellovibrio exovorus JSS]
MKLKDVFEKSVQFFKEKKIETARLDAELLISAALKFDRLQIYLKYEQPLSEAEVTACREVVRRRSQGEPVAYILGERGFYGEMFKVGAGVLIPRPETEMIVEEALEFLKTKAEHFTENNPPRILDLGAGTGCIGFSILKNHPTATLISVEKSPEAFSYLKQNQELLGLSDRSQLILADALDAQLSNQLSGPLSGQKFDVIVANPPYIASDDQQTEENVRKFEPASALFAPDAGFSALEQWSSHYQPALNAGGLMLFEMGYTQGLRMQAHFEGLASFANVQVLKDLSGLDRIIKALNN